MGTGKKEEESIRKHQLLVSKGILHVLASRKLISVFRDRVVVPVMQTLLLSMLKDLASSMEVPVHRSSDRARLLQDHSPTHDILRDLFTARGPDDDPNETIHSASRTLQTHDHQAAVETLVFLGFRPFLETPASKERKTHLNAGRTTDETAGVPFLLRTPVPSS